MCAQALSTHRLSAAEAQALVAGLRTFVQQHGSGSGSSSKGAAAAAAGAAGQQQQGEEGGGRGAAAEVAAAGMAVAGALVHDRLLGPAPASAGTALPGQRGVAGAETAGGGSKGGLKARLLAELDQLHAGFKVWGKGGPPVASAIALFWLGDFEVHRAVVHVISINSRVTSWRGEAKGVLLRSHS